MNFIFATKHGRLTLLVSLVVSCLAITSVFAQDAIFDLTGQQTIESSAAAFPTTAQATSSHLQIKSADELPRLSVNQWGQSEPNTIRPQDVVWLISARDSHDAPADLSRLQCSRFERGIWQNASLNELVQSHSSDKSKVTMLYVHGDKTNLAWATSRGLVFYRTAFQTAERPPVRFVIFAWRSERERARLVSDFKLKSHRSVIIGETLGAVLGQFEDRNLVVAGHSLGSQVVLAALSSPELQAENDGLGKYRVALIAHVLNPDFKHSDLAGYPKNPIVEQTDVFFSQDDRAVRLSQLVDRKRNRSQFSLRDLADMSQSAPNSILIRDVTDDVNNRHSISAYSESTVLTHQLTESLKATYQWRSPSTTDPHDPEAMAQAESKTIGTGAF